MFGASALDSAYPQEDTPTERDELLLAAAIHSALATENGKRLKDWLRHACFMDSPMNLGEIESTAQTVRIEARRDLFIVLEYLEKEGANVTSNE